MNKRAEFIPVEKEQYKHIEEIRNATRLIHYAKEAEKHLLYTQNLKKRSFGL